MTLEDGIKYYQEKTKVNQEKYGQILLWLQELKVFREEQDANCKEYALAHTIGEHSNTKYRKKPVMIEAFQFDGDLQNSEGEFYVPQWAVKAFEKGILRFEGLELYIETLEGTHHASVGDYIIQGVKGEIYPCKPDIFEATYDKE